MNKEQIQELIKETLEHVMKKPLEEIEAAYDSRFKEFKENLRSQLRPGTPGEVKKGVRLARFIQAVAAAKGHQSEAERFAKRNWGEDDEVYKVLLASDFAAGGAAVPPDYHEEIIELLTARSIVRGMSPIVMPMPNGSATLPKLTGGATASYVGEGDDIPESQQTFGDVRLTFRKLVALVPISTDLIRYASPQTEIIIRDDVVNSLGLREDIAFIRGDGTSNTPKGLRNWAHTDNVFAANATVNLANVTADLAKMILKLEEANVRMIRPGWLMAPRTKTYLMQIRDTNGNFAFREEMLNGTLWGFPFAVSTQIPTNLGGGADESELYLVDFADAVIGESYRLTIDASQEASYVSGGSLVSSYSRDQTLLRAITEHDFAMRHDKSIVVLTQVTWAP